MIERLVRLAAIVALAGAIMAMLAGLIPFAWLQPLGHYIRRPNDVTPERYARYLHVAWFFAATLGLIGILLWRRAAVISKSLCRTFPAGAEVSNLSSPQSWSNVEIAIAALIFVAGVGLRLSHLNDSMAYDEAYSYVNFAGRPWYEAIGDYNSTNNHLLNTFLMHWLARVFGPEEWALRLPVFVLGCLLPVCVIIWGRHWIGPEAGLLAGALTAIAPALVTYSVDARGYIFVAVAAVTLDAAAGRLARGDSPRAAALAALAIIVGLCAMPIMMYAVVSTSVWFLLDARRAAKESRATEYRRRWSILLGLAIATILPVALFYTPAYIFRGLLFLRDPIMQSVTFGEFLRQLGAGWIAAADWWSDGVIPGWIWLSLSLIGVWPLWKRADVRLRWLAPFVTVLALNLVQQVAPPPRIYLFLAPWAYLPTSIGALRIAGFCRVSPRIAVCGLAGFTLFVGVIYAMQHPVLFFPAERNSYVSVPGVIARLQQELQAEPKERDLLLAPLPCDLPSIFYMDRRGFRVPMNRQPEPGERVWLIARNSEAPADVLRDGLIRLADQEQKFEPWEPVETFETLTLYRSRFRGESRPEKP